MDCLPTDRLPTANHTLTYGILERLETPGVPRVPRIPRVTGIPKNATATGSCMAGCLSWPIHSADESRTRCAWVQRLLFKDRAGLNGGITTLPSNKKYLFSQHNKRPLDMAGTYYPTATEVAERVTLTTSTNEKCAACRCLSNSSSSLQLQCQRR